MEAQSGIKIVSDGTNLGTHILLISPDGTEYRLPNCIRASWHVSAREVPTARLEFVGVEIDVSGNCFARCDEDGNLINRSVFITHSDLGIFYSKDLGKPYSEEWAAEDYYERERRELESIQGRIRAARSAGI